MRRKLWKTYLHDNNCISDWYDFYNFKRRGTGEKTKEIQTNSYKNSLVYNLGELPDDLIMLDSDNVRQKDILANAFEGLVSSDVNGRIIPSLAESWSVSDEGTSYTFKIRKMQNGVMELI